MPAQEEQEEVAPGTLVHGYRIEKKLGSGGFERHDALDTRRRHAGGTQREGARAAHGVAAGAHCARGEAACRGRGGSNGRGGPRHLHAQAVGGRSRGWRRDSRRRDVPIGGGTDGSSHREIRQHPAPASTPDTGEDVQREHLAQQPGPIQLRRPLLLRFHLPAASGAGLASVPSALPPHRGSSAARPPSRCSRDVERKQSTGGVVSGVGSTRGGLGGEGQRRMIVLPMRHVHSWFYSAGD